MIVSLPVLPVAAQSLVLPAFTAHSAESGCFVDSDRKTAVESNLWSLTRNPSAMSFCDFRAESSGSAQLSSDYTSGKHHRAMDPDRDLNFRFSADSYNFLKNIDLYGSFSFTQQSLKGKTFSENYEPYNGNPYIVGSSLAGNYTKQLFEFKVAASSKCLWQRVRFGISADYTVGDQSRYNDPRSRVQLADYSVTSGFTVELSSCDRLGLSGTYRYRKEKMLKPVAKSENLDKYTYYTQKGVSEYSESGLLFFTRRYIGHYGGGEVQYAHRGTSWSMLMWGGAMHRYEDVIGERRENPGNYRSLDCYGGFSSLWGSGTLRSKAAVTVSCTSGTAEECLQEQVTETTAQGLVDSYWNTIMKNVRYRNSIVSGTAVWQITGLRGGRYLWDAGLRTAAEFYSSRYILPESSFRTSFIEPAITGGGNLFRRGGSEINLSGHIGWHQCLLSDYSPNGDLDAEKLTLIRDRVSLPDAAVFGRSSLSFGLDCGYIFASVRKFRFYCRLSTNQYYVVAGSSRASTAVQGGEDTRGMRCRIRSAVSVGIIY